MALRRPATPQAPRGSVSSARDYTGVGPNGPPYPWSVGGTSKEEGVPDNWADYYPDPGRGRADSWIGPKTQPGGRMYEQGPFLSVRDQQYAAAHPGYQPPTPQFSRPPTSNKYDPAYMNWLHPNRGTPNARGNLQPYDIDPHTGLPYGEPGEAPDSGPFRERTTQDDWANKAIARQQQNQQQYDAYRKQHGMPPISPNYTGQTGPLTYQPGGAYPPAAGGPKGGAATAQPQGRIPVSQENQAILNTSGLKPGQTATMGGRKIRMNEHGAIVDVTDPNNRRRLTDRQGNFLGSAAGLTAAERRGRSGPPTTPGQQVPRPLPPGSQPPPAPPPRGQPRGGGQPPPGGGGGQPGGYGFPSEPQHPGYGPSGWPEYGVFGDPSGFFGGRPNYSLGGLSTLFRGGMAGPYGW